MEIKLAATTRVAAPAPVDHPPTPRVDLPAPIDTERVFAKLNMPLRPTRPMNEYLDMSAMERTIWEIRSRSQTALNVQATSLHGADVAALLTG
jgi:hypothetical protein